VDYGIENHNQSSRFTFSGSAKITPNVKAGFEFMTEIATGPRTSNVDQNSPDGQGASTESGDAQLRVRTANWWLESSQLGRVTVGRINLGGPVGTIDLGGISTVAHFSPGLAGGSFFVAGGQRLATLVGPTFGGDRIEGIRYDSPSIGGFVAQASFGEDDVWSASLRYAGEFSGFRVAAGVGYQHRNPVNNQGDLDLAALAGRGESEWSAALSVMHVPTGLFAQGHYAKSNDIGFTATTAGNGDATIWLIQAGISKNWFGMGNTSLYGEYGKAEDFFKAAAAGNTSEAKFWGIGVVQQIDAAAMELYLGLRSFETDANAASADLDLVHGGARIRF
jgi:predicted porin